MNNLYFSRNVISSSVSFKDVVHEFKNLIEGFDKPLFKLSEWRHRLKQETEARKNYDLFLNKIREKVESLSSFLNQIEKALSMQVYCGTVNFTGIEFPVLGPFKEQIDEVQRVVNDLESFHSLVEGEKLCGLLLKMKELPPCEDKQSFRETIKDLVSKTSINEGKMRKYWGYSWIPQLGSYIREYIKNANYYTYGDMEDVGQKGFFYSIFSEWPELADTLTEIAIKSDLVYIQYFLTYSGIFEFLDKLNEVMEKFTSSVYGRMYEKLFLPRKE